MFPLTPDQHHWLEVATEDEGFDVTASAVTASAANKNQLLMKNNDVSGLNANCARTLLGHNIFVL